MRRIPLLLISLFVPLSVMAQEADIPFSSETDYEMTATCSNNYIKALPEDSIGYSVTNSHFATGTLTFQPKWHGTVLPNQLKAKLANVTALREAKQLFVVFQPVKAHPDAASITFHAFDGKACKAITPAQKITGATSFPPLVQEMITRR